LSEQEILGAPKEFQPIEDPVEADHLLKEAAKAFASAMIWTKDQGQVLRTHVSRYNPADVGLCTGFPKDFDQRAFSDALKRSGVNECYFSVSLSWANVFFKTPFVGTDSEGLRFRVPDRVYKVQRRKDLRFRIPEGQALKVQFHDPLTAESLLQKRVFDISASGFSFLINPEEQDIYSSGLSLKNVNLSIAGRAIAVEAQVKHRKQIQALGKTLIKVGCLFTAIRPGDSQKIASYVFEESRKYFLRFV